MSAAATVTAWEATGRRVPTPHGEMWFHDVPAGREAGRDPLLVLHGFPTCSYDWAGVLDAFAADRRVILPDFIGFGLSAKPDVRYSIRNQADAIEAVAKAAGVRSVALMTHDMGNSVGGELLRRSLEGALDFAVTERILTNGSIYIEMAQLSAGQELLLSLDDAATDLVAGDAWKGGVGGTYSDKSSVDPAELDAQWEFMARDDGQRLLPRTIRYIEDRRKEERRYTGAIEEHPSPLCVVWGADDPIAVVAMTDVLQKARPDADIRILDGVGHYPMVESPTRFTAAAIDA